MDAKADVNFTYKICYFYNVAVEFFVEMGSKMSFVDNGSLKLSFAVCWPFSHQSDR